VKKNIFGIEKVFYTEEFFLDLFNVPPISDIKNYDQVFRVFYLPSFHPEVCITICVTSDRSEISLISFQTNIGEFQAYHWLKAKGRWPEKARIPSEPNLWMETQHISRSHINDFVTEVDSLLSKPKSSDDQVLMLDGMSAIWEYGSALGDCFSYNDYIVENSNGFKFVYEVYKIASKFLKAEKSVRVLEHIFCYFNLDLPIKDLGGHPHCVRIFGSLSSRKQKELSLFFDRLPKSKPLLMDMSNFESMGTLLYPTFQQFVEQRKLALTVWWASDSARKHLEALGISSDVIFENREDAVIFLNR
jgi:hypothetical protein